ncbi:AAA family ATPase [Streptomyces sp. NPDC005181]|uniref:AAA family ATPase n=1 Tax=Streptomyces sp. NPDC005181 TaxID=3156869 RepID=UPI0033BF730C
MKKARECDEAPPVLLITGPAGARKSTLADAWARSRSGPTVHISLDDVRDWVKSGYANPEDGWSELSERQYVVARRCVARAVREYTEIGYACVVDDAVFPDWDAVGLDRWEQELQGLSVRLVVLMPSVDVLERRNSARRGHRRLAMETLEIIYGQMSGWRDRDVPMIDNSHMGVEEALRALDELMGPGES